MRTRADQAIIGRVHPAGLLRAEVARAADSHGGLVLVTGEAGIGKTTLVGQAADEARAKDSYRRRLAELDEAIDQAAGRGDDRRAAALDEERAALLEQLRAAAGLAGRARRPGGEAERARKTVTARIRHTLRRLDRRHPELAAHLRGAVSTGATCRYAPAEPVAWRL